MKDNEDAASEKRTLASDRNCLGSSRRELPRKRRKCDTLLTLIAPYQMTIAPARVFILGAEHELPAAVDNSAQVTFGHVRGK
jgi:hypothetical protein